MSNGKLVVIGAHPDDCELMAGGTSALYIRQGWKVSFITTTNGDAGHHKMNRSELAVRRKKESEAVANILGVEYIVMDHHDGELEPTLELRKELIRMLRQMEPDVVVTHPPLDYHPDHRYTSQVVGDTSYMLEVPLICPEVAAMTKSTAYLYDFMEPIPANATVWPVPIDEEAWKKRVLAADANESQMYEWLPFIDKREQDIPSSREGQLKYLDQRYRHMAAETAERHRARICELFGEATGKKARYAEAFYTAPFGRTFSKDDYQPLIDAYTEKV